MNLLLFSDGDRIEGDRIRISDHRLQHLQEVIDANEGDTLRVGEINGSMGTAELLRLEKGEAVLEVSLNDSPPEKLPLSKTSATPSFCNRMAAPPNCGCRTWRPSRAPSPTRPVP